jgi:hypothetical protein
MVATTGIRASRHQLISRRRNQRVGVVDMHHVGTAHCSSSSLQTAALLACPVSGDAERPRSIGPGHQVKFVTRSHVGGYINAGSAQAGYFVGHHNILARWHGGPIRVVNDEHPHWTSFGPRSSGTTAESGGVMGIFTFELLKNYYRLASHREFGCRTGRISVRPHQQCQAASSARSSVVDVLIAQLWDVVDRRQRRTTQYLARCPGRGARGQGEVTDSRRRRCRTGCSSPMRPVEASEICQKPVQPGFTVVRSATKSESNVAARHGISGRGPTRLIVPQTTSQSWGSSSRWNLRRKRPNGCSRTSDRCVLVGVDRRITGNERIFRNRNSLPWWPRRIWVKIGQARNEMAEPIARIITSGKVATARGRAIARSKILFFLA